MNERSGIIDVDGLRVLPLEGLWSSVLNVSAEEKLGMALEYAGCLFHDEERKLVAEPSVAMLGIGGVLLAREGEDSQAIQVRLEQCIEDSRILMASSAAFSYLNSGEKSLGELYEGVVNMGHLSVAHTVQFNILVAGITEATELELSLQRDLVHLSKVTNARTKIQDNPPLFVRDPEQVQDVEELRKHILKVSSRFRGETQDQREVANGLFPINKATLLMISGDVSNLRKLVSLKDDAGKERDLRDILDKIHGQLSILLPEIFDPRKDTHMSREEVRQMNNDYFADRLLAKLDETEPIAAAFEAQDVSRNVGFDFADFQDVVPRALDEIRETKEAFEEGPEGIDHYGDEIADIMFSLTNLARHGGLTDLPTIDRFIDSVKDDETSIGNAIDVIDSIGKDIEIVSDPTVVNSDTFEIQLRHLFDSGFGRCVVLARDAGFDPITLLRENVRKYLVRCQAIEELAGEDNKTWADLSRENQIIDYWKRAKTLLK